MKRILIACCLLAASASVSYAQGVAAPTPVAATKDAAPVVSKSDFTAKVTLMNTMLTKNQTTEAKAKWEELHATMMDALRVTKYKIKDAMEAKNDVDQKKYTELMMKQRNIYSETIRMKDDLSTNKVKMNEKLNEFAATIL
jgi:hypothetical protein